MSTTPGQGPDQVWADPDLSAFTENSETHVGTAPNGGSAGHTEGDDDEGHEDPYERARTICLTQLSFAARTRAELQAALSKRKIPIAVAEEVLDRYTELGLINDAEFAAAWVRSRQRSKGLSARAISRELHTKGISPADVESALEQIDEQSEHAAAMALVQKKLRSLEAADEASKIRRLVGMLARKGYSSGLSYRVVREALAADLPDPDL